MFDPVETWKKTRLPGNSYTMRELLVPIFEKGRCVYQSPSVMEIRAYCNQEKDTLWNETKRFVNPHHIYVDLSDRLFEMKTKLFDEMSSQ